MWSIGWLSKPWNLFLWVTPFWTLKTQVSSMLANLANNGMSIIEEVIFIRPNAKLQVWIMVLAPAPTEPSVCDIFTMCRASLMKCIFRAWYRGTRLLEQRPGRDLPCSNNYLCIYVLSHTGRQCRFLQRFGAAAPGSGSGCGSVHVCIAVDVSCGPLSHIIDLFQTIMNSPIMGGWTGGSSFPLWYAHCK